MSLSLMIAAAAAAETAALCKELGVETVTVQADGDITLEYSSG